MELPQNTPVSAQTQTRIAAPPSVVWKVLTELQRWPEWNPEIRWIRVYGDLQVGTVFRWKAGPSSIRATLRVVEPNRLLAWSGETLGIRAVHAWRLSADRAGTTVWTGETFEGILPTLLRGPLRKRLGETLEQGIAALRAECERQVADAAD